MGLLTRLDATVTRRPVAALLLLLLFAYRLAFGLCSEFWFVDEKQVYLIGLRFYSAGTWPFFGPDLVLKGVERVHQIPGALQPLLVGLPFFVLPVPEAPFVFLNLLSFAALLLLAWYGSRRVPALPRWLVYGLALTLPWTLHYSTHIVNPSYVLFGAVLFWLGASEALVFPDKPLLPPRLADFLVGFGVCWVMQLHLSWTLLVPIAGVAWLARARRGQALAALGAMAAGSLIIASLLLPTLLAHGLATSGNTQIAFRFNPINARDFVSILAKVLSFASYELPRFIAPTGPGRAAWVLSDWRVTPFAVLAIVVGILQPIVMLVCGFRRSESAPGWAGMKVLTAGTILLTWTGFLFTVREPYAHTFYLAMPLAFLYSLYCYAFFLKGERWQALALLVLVAGLVTNSALAWRNLHDRSLYLDRAKPAAALAQRDYRVLGERREGTRY